MKPTVAAMVIAAIAVVACGEHQSAAEAARADSSAAGYAVGPRPSHNGATANPSPTTPPAQLPNDTAATGSGEPMTPVAHSASSLATGPLAKPADTGPSKHAGGRAVGAAMGSTVATTAGAVHRDGPPDTPSASTRDRDADSSAVAGPVRVNEFLTYDLRSRTVSLQLIAGYNGLNGSLNYNGATKGNHGVYVPLGWRVHVAVTNHDSDLQHSAIVLEKVLPPPIEPTVPAFAGAALPQLDEGLAEDDIGTLDFVASRAGQYMIACGVPGHAQAGMWFQLAVLKGIAVPVYR